MNEPLDNIITCAVNYASERNHEYVTLEHLMLCCLEDEDVISVLDGIGRGHVLTPVTDQSRMPSSA